MGVTSRQYSPITMRALTLAPSVTSVCRVVRAAQERLDDEHHDVDPQQAPYQHRAGSTAE